MVARIMLSIKIKRYITPRVKRYPGTCKGPLGLSERDHIKKGQLIFVGGGVVARIMLSIKIKKVQHSTGKKVPRRLQGTPKPIRKGPHKKGTANFLCL